VLVRVGKKQYSDNVMCIIIIVVVVVVLYVVVVVVAPRSVNIQTPHPPSIHPLSPIDCCSSLVQSSLALVCCLMHHPPTTSRSSIHNHTLLHTRTHTLSRFVHYIATFVGLDSVFVANTTSVLCIVCIVCCVLICCCLIDAPTVPEELHSSSKISLDTLHTHTTWVCGTTFIGSVMPFRSTTAGPRCSPCWPCCTCL
jgi:hypothetical protein